MTVAPPRTKGDDILTKCQAWMTNITASKKEIQMLTGKLQHIARWVELVRQFMTKIFSTVREAPHTGRSHIPNELRTDIKWFLQYAQTTNSYWNLKSKNNGS